MKATARLIVLVIGLVGCGATAVPPNSLTAEPTSAVASPAEASTPVAPAAWCRYGTATLDLAVEGENVGGAALGAAEGGDPTAWHRAGLSLTEKAAAIDAALADLEALPEVSASAQAERDLLRTWMSALKHSETANPTHADYEAVRSSYSAWTARQSDLFRFMTSTYAPCP